MKFEIDIKNKTIKLLDNLNVNELLEFLKGRAFDELDLTELENDNWVITTEKVEIKTVEKNCDDFLKKDEKNPFIYRGGTSPYKVTF